MPVWGSSIPTQNTSIIPFQSTAVNPTAMAEFNRSMSAVRVSVEWLFGDFLFLDLKRI
jgi:hypothetical protein